MSVMKSTVPQEQMVWQPIIFDRTRAEDAKQMDSLIESEQVWRVYDTIERQLYELIRARSPKEKDVLTDAALAEATQELTGGMHLTDFGRWVYYPWSGKLVHLLPPEEFRELRSDRNRHKITSEDQQHLSQFNVGIVGLSVGNAVAMTLALEGAFGHLKLADFDQLSLSNMNRVRAGVDDIGLHKTVLAARQIYEMNPYATLSLFHEGLTPENLDEFLLEAPKLDVVLDECDDIRMKILLREHAKSLRLPVLMETSDRGMIDVERFDLEPNRPLLHGLLDGITSADIPLHLTDKEKVELVLPIAGINTISSSAAASMLEIGETISTWPQLGSDVTLGGASMTVAVRHLALGQPLPSGRRYIDIQSILTDEKMGESHAPNN